MPGAAKAAAKLTLKSLWLIISGFVFLGLGAVGVAIPVMPTTPFVLLAALCFSSGSKRFHDRLLRNRVFGPYIENYRTKQGISLKRKIAGIAFLWTGIVVSMLVTRVVWVCIALGVIGICVTIHLLLIKTKRKGISN